jgi:cytochrome c-type biogenesis protein
LAGAGLLGVYSLGLGIPFLVAAAFMPFFLRAAARFRRHLGIVEKGLGAFLVLTGILFITGGIGTISYWMLEAFPILGTLG